MATDGNLDISRFFGKRLVPKMKVSKELSQQERKELRKCTRNIVGFRVQGNLGLFIDKYLVCELLARKIIEYKNNRSNKNGSQNYTIMQIKASYKTLLNIAYAPGVIDIIFPGGEGIRGQKSPRQLRNGFIHSISKHDIEEIDINIKALVSAMDEWIIIFANI